MLINVQEPLPVDSETVVVGQTIVGFRRIPNNDTPDYIVIDLSSGASLHISIGGKLEDTYPEVTYVPRTPAESPKLP